MCQDLVSSTRPGSKLVTSLPFDIVMVVAVSRCALIKGLNRAYLLVIGVLESQLLTTNFEKNKNKNRVYGFVH